MVNINMTGAEIRHFHLFPAVSEVERLATSVRLVLVSARRLGHCCRFRRLAMKVEPVLFPFRRPAPFERLYLLGCRRFFGDHSSGGVAKPGGPLSQDLGPRIFAIGSYMGETIRRRLGGEWVGDDEASNVEITVALELTDGTR